MNVLTPFPNQTNTTQTFDSTRVARLRTEINQVFDAALRDTRFTSMGAQGDVVAFTGTTGAAAPVTGAGTYAWRNPVLSLQSEINRIINLVLQSAYAGQGQYSQPFAWQWGQSVPGWAGQQTVPFTNAFTGQIPISQYPAGAIGTSSVPGGSIVVTLLSEINRVFSSFMQDGYQGYAGYNDYSWQGRNPVAALQSEINRVFNTVLDGPVAYGQSFGTGYGQAYGQTSFGFTPCINLAETEDAIELEAELPGFSLGEIDLQVNGNLLTIKGWRRRAAGEEGKEFHLVERNYGTFTRSLTLPFEADPELIKASFEEGVLMITVSKPATVRENTHRITIAKAS